MHTSECLLLSGTRGEGHALVRVRCDPVQPEAHDENEHKRNHEECGLVRWVLFRHLDYTAAAGAHNVPAQLSPNRWSAPTNSGANAETSLLKDAQPSQGYFKDVAVEDGTELQISDYSQRPKGQAPQLHTPDRMAEFAAPLFPHATHRPATCRLKSERIERFADDRI